MPVLAASNFLFQYGGPMVAAAICVIGLLLGRRDAIRFSLTRTWAIASVALTQALRRRILWITPPLMLGIVIVSQLIRPEDEQQAVFQTIKVSLFATGLLVTLVTIIVAATNLPKEIENRVIYTVATKPATRLEIIVGKVIGLSCVTGLLLLIMGLFTYVYLSVREVGLRHHLQAQLASTTIDPQERIRIEHYASGLLSGQEIGRPVPFPYGLQIYSRLPQPGDTVKWMYGNVQQAALIPVQISEQDIPSQIYDADGTASDPPDGLRISAHVTYRPADPAKPAPSPHLMMGLVSENFASIISESDLAEPAGDQAPGQPLDAQGRTRSKIVCGKAVQRLKAVLAASSPRRFYIVLAGTGAMPYDEFGVGTDPARIDVILNHEPIGRTIVPSGPFTVHGSNRSFGQELRGNEKNAGAVAVYQFRKSPPEPGASDAVFELRTSVQGGMQPGTELAIEFVNTKDPSKTVAAPPLVPENNRTIYVKAPADVLAGGDFDVRIRLNNTDNSIVLRNDVNRTSFRMLAGRQSFAFNLTKSLLIQWMLSILVIIIAIFCSTFLSWPIAVMLTVVLLMGHWVVLHLQDTMQADLGRTIVNDLFRNAKAPEAEAISKTVAGLVNFTKISLVLPDVSKFAAIEDIEAGLAIPASTLWDALSVLALFGLPMTVMAYVFLKYKEVAP